MLARLRDWYRSTFGHAAVGAVLLWAALPPLGVYVLPWGALEGLGLPPLGPCLLAWLAPVWWVLLVRTAELPGRRPYRALWLAGFLFWLAALQWMRLPHWLTGFGWVALSVYLGFYLPVFVGLSRVAVHRLRLPVIVACPMVWTGLELARGHLLSGITMASLGHTQYRWIELIQIGDLAGAYGAGFVVMFVATCLARTAPCAGNPRSFRPLVPAVAVLGAAVAYGHLRVSREQGEPEARIGLIQGSIDVVLEPEPGTRERMHAQYRELSEWAVARYGDLDLIIWPETVFGYSLFDYDPDLRVPDAWSGSEAEFRWRLQQEAAKSRQPMQDLARHLDTPLLVGVTTWFLGADAEKQFNSAAFAPLSEEPIGRYDKMHLVMFGEYIPFDKELSWLVRLTPLSTLKIGVDPGREPAVFELVLNPEPRTLNPRVLRIAPNICYESVIPHLIRRQVNTLAQKGQEPDVLANLTNDGWFWGSSELDMHLVCGVFRAVECRKPFLIAANTGFSAWIDADGRIVAQGPRRATGVLVAEVAPDPRKSWYLAHGDWPAGVCQAACLLLAAVGLWDRFGRRRRSRTSRS